jgi:hypothetical protein
MKITQPARQNQIASPKANMLVAIAPDVEEYEVLNSACFVRAS